MIRRSERILSDVLSGASPLIIPDRSAFPSQALGVGCSARVPRRTARVPRPDITARVECCNAAAFSMTMRLYSAEVQVFWAIIKVRRAIVSHDATIISAMIKVSARLRRWMDLRIVSAQVATGRAVSRCSTIALGRRS